jgi:hypothetical protein
MRPVVVLMIGATLIGCGPVSPYRPTVTLAGADSDRYEADLRDCKKVAERDRYGPLLAGAVLGAGIGVGLGAVAGGYAGNFGLGESYGAIIGTMVGIGIGSTQIGTAADEKQIVDRCLRNNGYEIGG